MLLKGRRIFSNCTHVHPRRSKKWKTTIHERCYHSEERPILLDRRATIKMTMSEIHLSYGSVWKVIHEELHVKDVGLLFRSGHGAICEGDVQSSETRRRGFLCLSGNYVWILDLSIWSRGQRDEQKTRNAVNQLFPPRRLRCRGHAVCFWDCLPGGGSDYHWSNCGMLWSRNGVVLLPK